VQTGETGWDVADRGQRLFGFVLRFDQDHVLPDVDLTGAVLADGGRIDIASYRLTGLKGEHRYVASVPDGAKELVLQLTAGGHTEAFSLTQLAHTGPRPTVLYRDPLAFDLSREDVGEDSVKAADAGSADKGSLSFSLRRARLAFCTPPPGARAADDPAKAFLVATVEAESPSEGAQFQHYKALPASAFTATLPDGTVVPAQHSGPDDEGFTSGSYWFPVPGDTEAARITITPGTFDAYRYGMNGGEPTPVKADGSAVFDVEFTPGAAAKLPKLAKGQRAATTTTAAADDGGDPLAAIDSPANGPVNRRSDKGGGSALPVLVLLAALGGAGVYAGRRRGWQWPKPMDRRPAAHAEAAPAPAVAPAGSAPSRESVPWEAALQTAADATRSGAEVVVLATGDAAGIEQAAALAEARVLRDAGSLRHEVEAACLSAARRAEEADEEEPGAAKQVVVVVPQSEAGFASAAAEAAASAHVAVRVVTARPPTRVRNGVSEGGLDRYVHALTAELRLP
jgi:hypothetical protein